MFLASSTWMFCNGFMPLELWPRGWKLKICRCSSCWICSTWKECRNPKPVAVAWFSFLSICKGVLYLGKWQETLIVGTISSVIALHEQDLFKETSMVVDADLYAIWRRSVCVAVVCVCVCFWGNGGRLGVNKRIVTGPLEWQHTGQP